MAQVAVTQYCERVGSGLWAEPFNAFSNLAFLLAALWVLWRLHKSGLSWHQGLDLYLLSYLVRIADLSIAWALLWFVLFQLFNTGVQMWTPQDILNGSIFYLPTLLLLLLMTLTSYRLFHAHRKNFLLGSGLFVLSLLMRSVDRELCGVWPIGTHFLWHLLNASVLYLLTFALLPAQSQRPAIH